MTFPKISQFSQVKTSNLVESNASSLFEKFKLASILEQCQIVKEKGYTIVHMLYMMLIIILQRSRSMLSGIANLQAAKLKNPINSMLNDENYNWRNLLYRISKRFAELCPTPEGQVPVLIIDDTSKEKSGRRGEFISWFMDHCRQVYYMGYQVVMSVWHNGVVAIPLDFELKIGKSRVKHAKKGIYRKGTHTEQRQRMAKQKKTKIAESFIRRAMLRCFEFRYVLWDSWYNNSSSYRFVFETLKSKGIDLVAMVKRDGQKYLWGNSFLKIKQLYRKAGKWQHDKSTGIMCKSIVVGVLDKNSGNDPELQTVIGRVKMCFFKYPSQKRYKALISTDLSLSEMEILSIYMRRWSIEVVFKDLKQHFGFYQSKSSKYAPQIADLTIRCVFYNMFCSMKYQDPSKSTEQLMLEFYYEMEESWLDIFSLIVFANKAESLLKYALSLGYSDTKQLLRNYEYVLRQFINDRWHEDGIEEMDKHTIIPKNYRKVS